MPKSLTKHRYQGIAGGSVFATLNLGPIDNASLACKAAASPAVRKVVGVIRSLGVEDNKECVQFRCIDGTKLRCDCTPTQAETAFGLRGGAVELTYLEFDGSCRALGMRPAGAPPAARASLETVLSEVNKKWSRTLEILAK